MRWALLFGGLGLLVLALFLASLLTGPAGLGVGQEILALFGRGDRLVVMVMQEIRLPRALLGVLLGASLGMAGAAVQGFLRNPLAEPGLIGTSASAALGAVLALQTGLTAVLPLGSADGAPAAALTAPNLAEVFGITAHFAQTPQGTVFQPLDILANDQL